MAFKLFRFDPKTDPQYVETAYNDLENKQFWCARGATQEIAFVDFLQVLNKKKPSGYQAAIHPAKEHNDYHPDLLVTGADGKPVIGEVKSKNSPLFMARQYGVDPQYALTMDLKDSFNYLKWLRKGIDITIFIWVEWQAHRMVSGTKVYDVNPMKGLWVTTFSRLREHEKISPPGIHWYREAFRHPPSYDFDTSSDEQKRWCQELLDFDGRLGGQVGGHIKGIASKGFHLSGGDLYPAGHSSASYVFDLMDAKLFDRLYYRQGLTRKS